MERGALALDPGAVGGQRPVHQLGETAADREPQARPAIPARDGRVHLAERLEQPVHAVGGDADPRVPHVEGDLPGVDVRPAPALEARAAEPQLDLAVLRELEGVGQQVEGDLPHPSRVADEPDRQVRIHRVHELQPALGRHRRHQVEGALDRAPELERLVVQVDLARLDLGEVEDVVDDREQGVGRRLDRLGVVRLLRVQLRVLEQAAHADDRVHRRPDLVAHRGEERGLGEVRLLGGTPGGQGVLVEPGVVDRDRRLVRQALEEGEVRVRERGSPVGPPHGGHADQRVAGEHRGDHEPVDVVRLLGAGDRDRARVGVRVVHDLRSVPRGRAADDALAQQDRVVEDARGVVAPRHERLERLAVRLREIHRAGLDAEQVQDALGEAVEHAADVERRRDLAGDRRQRAHLVGTAVRLVDQACGLDRHAQAGGDRLEQPDVGLAERVLAVQVLHGNDARRLARDDQRRPQRRLRCLALPDGRLSPAPSRARRRAR